MSSIAQSAARASPFGLAAPGFGERQAAPIVGAVAALLFLIICPGLLLSIGAPMLALPAIFAVVFFFVFRDSIPALLIATAIFQNVAIAFWVEESSTVGQISTARALSFLVMVSLFAAVSIGAIAARQRVARCHVHLVWLSWIVLVVIGGQTALGIPTAGLNGAAAYARNISLLPIALALGLLCQPRNGTGSLRWFSAAFVVLLVFGYVEMAFREELYPLVGFDRFMLRTSERSADIQYRLFLGFSQYLNAQQTALFNDPNLDAFSIIRLQGPTAHPISFGYALVITSLPLLARAPLTVLLLQAPLQYGINSKGAVLLLLACAGARLGVRILLSMPSILRALAVVTVWAMSTAAGIVLGLRHGDFHVLGFLGGLKAFVAKPLGHGVGTSGNLTETGVNGRIDWVAMQHAGSADRGIESAVGVMLDQLGAFSAVYFLLAVLVIRQLIVARDPLHIVLATAAIGLIANGVLQEEALFSPSSAGLLFFMIGLVLAAQPATSGQPVHGRSASFRPADGSQLRQPGSAA